ncbi:MAG: O-antigen ligase family protein [Patescibacteria group bacterium]
MMSRSLARYLALATVVLLPLYYFRFDLMGLPTNFIEVLIGLLLVLTLISYRRVSLPNAWPIGLILAGVVLASFFALDQRVAFGIVKGWFVIPIIYYACLTTIFSSDQRQVFVKPVLINLTVVSLYAIGQYFGLIGLLAHQLPEAQQYLDQGRAVGFFESPNFLAMYLVPPTLVTGGYLALTRNFRLLAWLIIPLVAIALSQSQAGLLALGAGIVWLMLWGSSKSSVPSRATLIGVAVGAVAVLLVLWKWADDPARWLIWQKSWQMIKDQPILGIGPGQFQANFLLLGDLGGQFATTLPYALHPHNLFLNVYLSTGLLGLIGSVWFLAGLGKEFFRNTARSPLAIAAASALVAVLVHGLFDSTIFKNDLAIIFWLLVFLIGNSYKEGNADRA